MHSFSRDLDTACRATGAHAMRIQTFGNSSSADAERMLRSRLLSCPPVLCATQAPACIADTHPTMPWVRQPLFGSTQTARAAASDLASHTWYCHDCGTPAAAVSHWLTLLLSRAHRLYRRPRPASAAWHGGIPAAQDQASMVVSSSPAPAVTAAPAAS